MLCNSVIVGSGIHLETLTEERKRQKYRTNKILSDNGKLKLFIHLFKF